jgi:hypothetical protein
MRALGVGAFVVALSASAHADPAAELKTPYALAWVRDEGTEGCPAGRDFADEVTRRLGRSPFDARADRAIEIRVDREGAAYRSRVVVRERDGRVAGQRLLSSPKDCAPLFSATALAVALLIDPEATLHADASATEAVAKFEVVEPPPAASPPPKAPARAPIPSCPPPAPDPSPTPPLRSDVGGVSMRAALAIGMVPGVVPGAELFVRKRLGERFSGAASALYLASGEATAAGATFKVGLAAFNLSGLLELVDSETFATGVELGAWAGALRTAVQTPPPADGAWLVATTPADAFYLSVDAGLHARLRLAGPVLLEARALAVVPLLRHRLEVKAASAGAFAETPANTEVWLQPAASGLGTLGLGVPFP